MVAASEPRTRGQTVWHIDPAHSAVEFGVKHMMFTTVKGRFSGVTGQVVTEGGDPTRGAVEVEVDASTIDTRDEKRDEHLKSADFLGVEKYPTIRFESSRASGGPGDTFQLIGNLTIHGVAREVILDATHNGSGTNPWGQEVAGYSAEVEFNRKDFGLAWNATLDGGGVLVGETVKVTIEIQAAKQV